MAAPARPAAPTGGRGPQGFKPGAVKALGSSLTALRGHWPTALGAAVSLVLVLVANLSVPQLVRWAIDGGLRAQQPRVIAVAVGGLLVAAALRGLFSFLQDYLAERTSQGVAYDLREALFARIQKLSFSYYDQAETGQLLTRLTNDVEQIRTFSGSGLLQIAQAAVMLVASTVLLLSLNWRLSLAAMSTIPVIFFLLAAFVRRIGPIFGKLQGSLSRLNTLLQEDLTGVRIVRAFGREARELERYREANQALLDLNLDAIRASSNNFPVIMFMANLGTLAVFGFGGLEILGGQLTIGELIAFNSYLGFLIQPIMALGFSMMIVARAATSALRVQEILEAPIEVADAPGALELGPLTGQVVFDSVSFRYPGGERDVLSGVSFTLEAGQTVAVVGSTGSGKSTLSQLLPRFYDVTGGRILVDGHDVREVKLASLRSQIGLVRQEPLLFPGTIRENLAYGRPDATPEEIERAAAAAQAARFIAELPQGYDTVIGERGVGLSGGQRQRLAIARALLVNPKLLILDDSTSSVDAETEAALRESMDRLIRDRRHTALVIAQRLSSVVDADVVLVLDGGRIVAQGPHDQLSRTCAIYQDLLGNQLAVDRATTEATA